QLAGVESDNRIRGHAAIGTADPEIMGRLLAFEAPEEVRILRGHTRCPGAIPFLQVVRCQSIHVLAGNKCYRVTYLVRREMLLPSSTSEGHPGVCGATENRANEFARGNRLWKVHPSGTIGQKRGLVKSSGRAASGRPVPTT